jgi:DNA-binding CsgD family transcriptional regulator/PAS domain-containing protein
MPAEGAPPTDGSLTAIAALYDAALDERLWPDALRILTEVTGSQASSFWVLDRGSPSLLHPTFITINFDRKAVDEYLGGMAPLDPTVRYLVAHPNDSIVHDGMLGSGRDEQTRCYLDWHERSVETRFRLVAQCNLAAGLQAGIALHRAREAGRYEPADIERFRLMHQHLSRALTVGAKVGSLTSLQRLGEDLLDRSSAAIFLLDSARRVVFMNRAAEAMKTREDDLRVSADGLHLSVPREDEQLQSLIRQAAASSQRPVGSPGEVMRASRRSGRRPYGVWVIALARVPAALSLFRPALCVLISDPERRLCPSVQHLRTLFNMTDAEARLAVLLADGESLRLAAEHLGITYGTTRSRLTQLLEKTSTRSQTELIRLLLTVLTCQ